MEIENSGAEITSYFVKSNRLLLLLLRLFPYKKAIGGENHGLSGAL